MCVFNILRIESAQNTVVCSGDPTLVSELAYREEDENMYALGVERKRVYKITKRSQNRRSVKLRTMKTRPRLGRTTSTPVVLGTRLVIIVLDVEDHPICVRFGPNLVMRMSLQAAEAMCGFTRTVKTLDDRKLIVTSPAVVKYVMTGCIMGESMPTYENPLVKGCLIIKLEVSSGFSNCV